MADVFETKLPGVGVRHDFQTEDGRKIGVVVHRTGRREVVLYQGDDPDACVPIMNLSESDTRVLGELLGTSQVAETVGAVQHEIDGLAIEWVPVPATSDAAGRSIEAGQYRTHTGTSVIAVVRGEQSIPAPAPDFELEAGDTVVAVGTTEGLAKLRTLIVG